MEAGSQSRWKLVYLLVADLRNCPKKVSGTSREQLENKQDGGGIAIPLEACLSSNC